MLKMYFEGTLTLESALKVSASVANIATEILGGSEEIARFLSFLETRSHYMVLAGLEFAM